MEQLCLVGKGAVVHGMSGPRAGVFMTDHVPTIDEIDNVDKLAVYLATQPIQVAQIVAFRSALRILPFSYQAAFLENDIHLAGRLRVSAFRALFCVGWTYAIVMKFLIFS